MIEDKIKELCDSIPVPDSLSPEQMEQRLTEQTKKNHILPIKKSHLTAAACLFVLVIGGSVLAHMPFGDSTTDTSTKLASISDNPLSYDDYYTIIDGYLGKQKEVSVWDRLLPESVEEKTATSDVASDSMSTGAASNALSGSSSNYTKTNIQVDGVDEGDIVKTDGTYIYACSEDAIGSTIRIVKADGENTQKISSFCIDQFSIYEFYIDNGILTAIGRDWSGDSKYRQQTALVVYDISDVNHPILRGKRTQSGDYETSRKNGKYLYTISLMHVDNEYQKSKKETYIPGIDDTLVPEANLHRPKDLSTAQYIVITALDITNPDQYSDSCAILNDSEVYYVSEKNLYIVSSSHEHTTASIISKFNYHEGQLDFVCETTVRAEVLNQFSLDEHNGYLRFVGTTQHLGTTSNGLYILDEQLKAVGSVSHLAAGERIYSSRFMGNYAYFVTYRETDPLFAVDLTNPQNPVVLDALKIPGFSEYLHPYGDGLLLGVGQDISDGNERVKLSMFDISSPKDLKELNKQLLDEGSYSMASSNHKALLVDPERNTIGFAIENYSGESTYVMYRYTKNGFKKIASLTPPGLSFESSRGLFIGKYFYLVDAVNAYGVFVYDAESMKEVGTATY
nr:beta-propeller domain-containing protein [Eubacterium sp.]